MTYETVPLELTTAELEFLRGVPSLANKLNLPPDRSIELMGNLVNMMVQYEHDQHGTGIKQAMTEAIGLFMKGLGTTNAEIQLDVTTTPPEKDLH